MLATSCGDNSAQIDWLPAPRRCTVKWMNIAARNGGEDHRQGTGSCGEHNEDDSPVSGTFTDQGDKARLAKFNAKFAVVRAGKSVRIPVSTVIASDAWTGSLFLARPILAWRSRTGGSGSSVGTRQLVAESSGPARILNIDFNPGSTREGEYNFWQGFPVLRRRGPSLILAVCPRRDLRAMKATNISVAVGSHGSVGPANARSWNRIPCGQGTGKNTFVEALGSLVAPHHDRKSFGTSSSIQCPLMNRLIIHANEALWALATNTRLGN
jgi:hypothetical protein